ncbi:uncharacterized protein BO88DRAFT_416191 [Aspergillus vadensis CBS 113365]|uniref:Uncharacterized protein n=1 Tax=Aspergillus vadensis (strain CBS 113365 / IMI 142717 / IBT 24658) TaxID=1448311 RepID=A0A319B668_ASPVC|nr:hypothetical protein BO88DRAFT_416191 [Aspergillus vadensis CBS 113365]PYH67819.1 hypothetical protein BO88DRAFT_416191 [Aspergillus vadensis CBS 113365]
MALSLMNLNIFRSQKGEIDDDEEHATEKAGLLHPEPYQLPRKTSRQKFSCCVPVLFCVNICLLALLSGAIHLLQKQYFLYKGPDPPYCKSKKEINRAIKTDDAKQAPLREDGVVQYMNTIYEPDAEFQLPIVPGKEDPWTRWALGRATGVARGS